MLVIAILAGLAVVAAYLEPAEPPLAGLARVSDGDSFRLGGQRIRLLGIDAPELSQTCLDERGERWSCGLAARDRMADLLGQGPVDCRPEDKDKYQRLLAFCTVVENDLGAVMVREGLAISAGSYWGEEAAARADAAGIWKGGFDTPRNWRQDHTGQRHAWGWLSAFGL